MFFVWYFSFQIVIFNTVSIAFGFMYVYNIPLIWLNVENHQYGTYEGTGIVVPVSHIAKKYNKTHIFNSPDLDTIRRDVQSRLWCTYRRGFVPIGGSQLTTDKGWGCMLRCGQMVLAQALTQLHLGRNWFWTPESNDETYLKIVNRFEDSKAAPFSLHQIALTGESSEEKRVGEWFGPNTVAQVLK